MKNELHVEHLLGRKVVDAGGEKIGHIEEIVTMKRGDEVVVTEFHIGRGAYAERFSIHGAGTTFLWYLGARRHSEKPHRIKWRDLDLSDPENPRFRKSKNDLAKE
jgi:hypothetical protein